MKTITKLWASAAICGAMLTSMAHADPHPDAELIIEGELHIATRAEPAEHLGGVFPEIYSGWLFRTFVVRFSTPPTILYLFPPSRLPELHWHSSAIWWHACRALKGRYPSTRLQH